ncbi:hypothetical protein, partial [Paenibacillus sp. F4]|uniref:hypothetical protein n=1 Tax=Paenibacillus sp. F4 TaxID=357385 RepID=UPI000CB9AD77
LLNGSELICSEEGILSHRLEPDFTAITTDPNAEYMDLLALIDSLQQQVAGLNEESLANFQTAAERGKQLAERDRTIAKLQEALIFYWKPEKYVADEFYEDGHPKSCVITRDRGKKAEEVLKPYEM